MSLDIRLDSIKAYKRMIRYFKKQIDNLEREIFTEQCCFEKLNKERIYLPIVNKPKITK